jgi:hypothetical protein
MKRRTFIAGAGLIGSAAPLLARAQARPCAPPTIQATPNPAASTPCIILPPTTAGTPAWLSGKALHEWTTLPSPRGSNILPLQVTPGNVKYVADAWGGGTVRAEGSYYILHGGGHGDYAGNEIYVLRMSADSPIWTRIWGPSLLSAIVTGNPFYLDGNPASIHTYYTLHFDNQEDVLRRVQGGWYREPSGVNPKFNSWPWGAARWNPDGTHPDIPGNASPGAGTVIHPTTGDIYYWSQSFRAVWRKSMNRWVFTDAATSFSHLEGPLGMDTANNCVWAIGGYNTTAGQIHRWDVASNAVTTVNVTGNGTAITAIRQIGMDYCPALRVFYLYNAGVVYRFDPVQRTIDTVGMIGTGPQASYPDNTGVWGKFKFVPALEGFVVTPAWDSPTFFFRVT